MKLSEFIKASKVNKASAAITAVTVLLSGCYDRGSDNHADEESVVTTPQNTSGENPATNTNTDTSNSDTPTTDTSVETPTTDTASTDNTPADESYVVTLDATAGGSGATTDNPKNKFTYFNLATGKEVDLTDAQAQSSTEWHIALKRTNVMINGGISGPAGFTAGVADPQTEFYDENGKPIASHFLNATADSEFATFDNVVASEGVKLALDKAQAVIDGSGSNSSWFSYNVATHQISANTENWWLLRAANGSSFAKFHTLTIDQSNYAFEFEFQLADPATAQFDSTTKRWSTTVSNGQGSRCFDIETFSEVDCAANPTTWDLMLELAGRSWNLWTNGGIHGAGKGGAFGPFDSAKAATYVNATQAPSGEPITSHYQADKKGGIFSKESWYAYAVTQQPSDHGIYPNFKVYIIDTGDTQYKIQLLDYYDASGLSGYITMRYQAL